VSRHLPPIHTENGRRVIPTRHALHRLEHRCCDAIPMVRAMREVADAIDQGRTATRIPSTFPPVNGTTGGRARAARRRSGGGGTFRYAWNADQSRAYLVDLSKRDVALIITIITPPGRKETAA
jgi:hypothetical protein